MGISIALIGMLAWVAAVVALLKPSLVRAKTRVSGVLLYGLIGFVLIAVGGAIIGPAKPPAPVVKPEQLTEAPSESNVSNLSEMIIPVVTPPPDKPKPVEVAEKPKSVSETQPDKPKPGNNTPARREVVQKYFKSGKEPKVKDALWTTDNLFKVGVFDDGTSRDGYANYVCNVLYENGFEGSKIGVQVIDIGKLVKDGDWVKLGEARCK